ncbi:MAG TPA: DNA-formamidopyrimidine glycosylase family protein [Bacteroidota bacterium]|nr:DNA-formamidopyrimidine glycosylase family protein [Bacteroidota bacterium]
MPELPDVTIYIEALASRIVSQPLQKISLASPFLLRSVDPPIAEAEGKKVISLRRIGKQIVWDLEGNLFLVFHLMIAGRFHWKKPGTRPPGKIGLASFHFPHGSLLLTEASTKKRASLHLTRGEESLAHFRRGGVEVLEASLDEFRSALTKENHTLKRSLTDPRLFSGIGNAYSDEILHRAKLSPLQLGGKLDESKISRLFLATRETMHEWTERLRKQIGSDFPEKVTAFHEEMAVHGKFGKPCPVYGTRVQRIVYAENECNYCPRCQTSGKILADRSLSRLLKDDWPKTIEELEAKE